MKIDLRKLDPRLRALSQRMGEQKYAAGGETAALVLAHDQLNERRLNDKGATHIARLTEYIWSVRFAPGSVRALHDLKGVAYIEGPQRLFPMLARSVPDIDARPSDVGAEVDGRQVVVGIIDYGIDWTLQDFCETDGKHTRIKYLWDQSLERKGTEQAPEQFGYGVEYDEQRINTALEAWRGGDQVRAKSLVRHRPWPASDDDVTDTDGHGTHVAGIACGNGASQSSSCPQCPPSTGRYQGIAPGAWIVFVHLSRGRILGEVGGSGSLGSSPELAEAIAYCYRKADELSQKLDKRVGCVVNLSMGFNGGSHDGESLVERLIDTMLEGEGRALVVAAGNQRDQGTYYTDTVQPRTPYALKWIMGGPTDDRTLNEMEIWYRSEHSLNVRLISPSGETSEIVETGQSKPIALGGITGIIDSQRFTPLNGDSRIYVQVKPGAGQGMRGCWILELTSPSQVAVPFDAWIEREAGIGFTATDPRQSRFDHQDLRSGQRATKLTVPATARRAITVGALGPLKVMPRLPSLSSGTGPTRDGRPKPELMAPGTNICSNAVRFDRTSGIDCAHVQKSGTSMAAPHVTGIIALMLQLKPALTSAQIKQLLVASAEHRGGSHGFDPAWGFGVVNAAGVLQLVRRDLPVSA